MQGILSVYHTDRPRAWLVVLERVVEMRSWLRFTAFAAPVSVLRSHCRSAGLLSSPSSISMFTSFLAPMPSALANRSVYRRRVSR